MKHIVGVQFKQAARIYTFECGDTDDIKQRDKVIVETEFGLGLGKVVIEPRTVEDDQAPPDLKKVVRAANEADIDREKKNKDREKTAFDLCSKLIAQKNLGMKLVDVEYFFDASKAIFYFSAEHRVDFRELVRDMARSLHTRIEMKQIGVRDETKLIGGLGCCGQQLCCTTFLREFHPVSVKMAKEQNLAMNPGKISGLCGRLMCCLAYEHPVYEELGKDMPKKGRTVETPDGPVKVLDVNLLKKLVTISTESGATVTCPLSELSRSSRSSPSPPTREVKPLDIPPPEVTPMEKEKNDDENSDKRTGRRGRRRRKKSKGNTNPNANS